MEPLAWSNRDGRWRDMDRHPVSTLLGQTPNRRSLFRRAPRAPPTSRERRREVEREGGQGSRTGIESAQAAACSPAGQSRAGRTRPHVQSWTGIEPAYKVGQASNPPGVGAASSRSVPTGRTRGTRGTNSDRHRILGQASNPGIESWGDRIGVTPRLFTGMCGLASS